MLAVTLTTKRRGQWHQWSHCAVVLGEEGLETTMTTMRRILLRRRRQQQTTTPQEEATTKGTKFFLTVPALYHIRVY